MYHVSNEAFSKNQSLEVRYGSVILDERFYTFNDHNHDQYLREMILEEHRLTHFPNKPSRLKCLYLFEDIKSAKKYLYERNKKFIYTVEVDPSANIHKVDMSLINQTVRTSINHIRELAQVYFDGAKLKQDQHEILCEGDVKIKKKVFEAH